MWVDPTSNFRDRGLADCQFSVSSYALRPLRGRVSIGGSEANDRVIEIAGTFAWKVRRDFSLQRMRRPSRG